jgi:hypothetical protein
VAGSNKPHLPAIDSDVRGRHKGIDGRVLSIPQGAISREGRDAESWPLRAISEVRKGQMAEFGCYLSGRLTLTKLLTCLVSFG